MIAAVLSMILSVAPPLAQSFEPPKGWVAKAPPPSAVDYIWLSPHFGSGGNGENFTATGHDVTAGSTLASEVRVAIADLSQDRDITNSHSDPTCHGQQAGWAFAARITLPNGPTIEQLYHFTIVDRQVWAFVFTHKAGDRVDPAIAHSIQSICSSAKTT
jgi:hypothetical protein